jgi:guanine deaminase
MTNATQPQGIRGALLDLIADPFYHEVAESVRYIPDGVLVIAAGKIQAIAPYADIIAQYPDLPITDYRNHLIVPGLIDTHIHFPQMEMIAAYGEQLLTWLNTYTFPTEAQFKDPAYAAEVADRFLTELLRHGTTTALVFATVHPESVEAFFSAAQARRLRMISGKVLMDRHAPENLRDTPEQAYHESKALIEKWHGRDRLLYAVTPRFAITSSPEQLAVAGRLLAEFPDVYLHTHLSENEDEVAWVRELFPDRDGYLDVYDRAGLVGPRSIFAHGVQLTPAEFARLSVTEAAIAFCPTSNLFLGSGLFKLEQAKHRDRPVKLGLGTDIGAGTSFSLLQTANEAYKVAQLRRQTLSPFQALYLATLGGAHALNLDPILGNFNPGKEADFIVLDRRATPLLQFRNPETIPTDLTAIADQVFSLIILGDDRAIHATHILGDRVILPD